MQTHKARIRIPMTFFASIPCPTAREVPDLTDPEVNDFIADPDAPGPEPPEFAPTGEHRPSDPYADPRKNSWIPAIP